MSDIPIKPTNRVAVAYIRAATLDQAGSRIGLKRQWLACKRHAQDLGLNMTMIYADMGASGLPEHRPALNQMMTDLARDHTATESPNDAVQ